MKEVLPIGSVVNLKARPGSDFVIIGYGPILNEKNYDYSGVVLPVGFISSGSMIAFNESSIEKVLFKGYEDEKTRTLEKIVHKITQQEEWIANHAD